MFRLTLRFVMPLAAALAAIAYLITPVVESVTLKWFVRDLDIRARLIARTIEPRLLDAVGKSQLSDAKEVFETATADERLFAMGYCTPSGTLLVKSKLFPKDLGCQESETVGDTHSFVFRNGESSLHVSHQGLGTGASGMGKLILVHDMSFIGRRSESTKRYLFYLFVAIASVISLITVIVAYFSQRGLVEGMRSLLRGNALLPSATRGRPPAELRPLVKDLQSLIKDLEQDRRVRDESQISWTPQSLKSILQSELSGEEVLVVSNREPYIHVRREGRIEVQVPASGLVTALEPVMRACSGTWIAHGSGSADRDTVDSGDRVEVPLGSPSYRLRRVWLTKEEEAGYYYGFANEGIWPLCHIAHTRPSFKSADWEQYLAVNQKFADAVIDEAKTDDPVILVQDYHLALAPRLIRERLPRATIITFWHIPWPNPESFGICPWRNELLEGLLGSSIIGFHTRFHCNNFIDTVDRFLEARIDRDTSNISLSGRLTAIRSYPISIEWPSRWLVDQPPVDQCRARIRNSHSLSADHLIGLGVDRLDYTKGILERFLAVERLLELEPKWVGRFSLLQVAAPSRSAISEYQNFEAMVRAEAARINMRFGSEGYQPIILDVRHHEPHEVFTLYRAADVCVVTSLHDGMNLVAKEFISSRDDGDGVLILSQFAGAARELAEALIVNPYNIDQMAMALRVALSMEARERRARMMNMRALVREFNVYRWAGRMLIDAARLRRQERLSHRFSTATEQFLSR